MADLATVVPYPPAASQLAAQVPSAAPVKTQHAQYDAMRDRWQRCRDVTTGQDAVHTAGDRYLPRLRDQLPEEYTAYVRRATFYNATWRTIAGLIGMIFRKPPVTEAPESVKAMLEDVTLQGQPF